MFWFSFIFLNLIFVNFKVSSQEIELIDVSDDNQTFTFQYSLPENNQEDLWILIKK